MTEDSLDSVREIAEKIVRQLDKFEIHLTNYQDRVRRALTEEPTKTRPCRFPMSMPRPRLAEIVQNDS